jgi:amino acid transporter
LPSKAASPQRRQKRRLSRAGAAPLCYIQQITVADVDREQQFLQAEHRVELHSAELRKELRLTDLVLSQVLYIMGLQWFGTAGKLGSAHIVYWIPAVLLFYIPSAIVVVHLNGEMPLEGGLYQWAKLRFGELAGFLVALNLWATMVLLVASMVSQLVDNLGYAAGPSGAWIVENKSVTIVAGAMFMGGLMWVAVRGLAVAKWLHNGGGVIALLVLAGMALFALPRWLHGGAAVAPASFRFPEVSLLNLNILGKMGFGAFCGFDGCAIFSGEVRSPDVARTIRRSVWLAAPLIAFLYILGTASALAFTRPGDLDLISPTTQALSRGAQAAGLAWLVAPVVGILMVCNITGNASLYNNAVIRLPMVAGWDHLLPEWLARLHPRFRTPVGSILAIGVATFALTVLGNLGTGAQESFQLLNNSGIICWALTYIVMFAIPLVASGEKPRWEVRVAAVAGLGMTLLYVILSIFPIVDVKNAASFTAKTIGVVAAINVAGAWYYWRASKRRDAPLEGDRQGAR